MYIYYIQRFVKVWFLDLFVEFGNLEKQLEVLDGFRAWANHFVKVHRKWYSSQSFRNCSHSVNTF